jgi:hypothetical protein
VVAFTKGELKGPYEVNSLVDGGIIETLHATIRAPKMLHTHLVDPSIGLNSELVRISRKRVLNFSSATFRRLISSPMTLLVHRPHQMVYECATTFTRSVEAMPDLSMEQVYLRTKRFLRFTSEIVLSGYICPYVTMTTINILP